MRVGATVFFAVALVACPRAAEADDLVESTLYVGERRLGAQSFPGPPGIERDILGEGLSVTHVPARDDSGVILHAAVAVEHQGDCGRRSACPFPGGGGSRTVDETEYITRLAPNHIEWGESTRVGWELPYIAVEAGALVFTQTFGGVAPRLPKQTTLVAPDLVVRLGPRWIFFAAGMGSYSASTIVSGGYYVQGQLAIGERWAAALTGSLHGQERYGSYQYLRADLEVHYRILKRIRLGQGIAAAPPSGLELRAQVAWFF